MNCFYHKNTPAVGSCKSCSKGLCIGCDVDLGHGLACKNNHEEQVKALDMLITKNVKIYSSASKNTLVAPTFYFFIGVVFSGYGYFSKSGVTSFPFVIGVGFIVFATLVFIKNKRMFEQDF